MATDDIADLARRLCAMTKEQQLWVGYFIGILEAQDAGVALDARQAEHWRRAHADMRAYVAWLREGEPAGARA
jgi:hypothetical protein